MPLIIPIFINNRGCPHRCIFCNEKMIAGNHPDSITEDTVGHLVQQYLSGAGKSRGEPQIAFYGGNFTGLDWREQLKLLKLVSPFLESGRIHSLRISTRPDAIDGKILDRLYAYRVRTVEIGAQSMNDEVLKLSGRGHTAQEVIRAVRMLKEKGMEAGIHLMAGLPGDSRERFQETVERAIAMKPSMVRIHPAIVFRDTELARMFVAGSYLPLGIDQAVDFCKSAVQKFAAADIPVVRLGLQTTPEMESPGSILAGPYHPAFGSLVYESIFYDMAKSLLTRRHKLDKEVTFRVSPGDVSHLRGHRNCNLKNIKEVFGLREIIITPDPNLGRGVLLIHDKASEAPPLSMSLSSLVYV